VQVRTEVPDKQLGVVSVAKAIRKRAGGKKADALRVSPQPGHDARTYDELASLSEENIRLMRLLSEKLTVGTDALKMMLSRFRST
jgi:hypothetical protein